MLAYTLLLDILYLGLQDECNNTFLDKFVMTNVYRSCRILLASIEVVKFFMEMDAMTCTYWQCSVVLTLPKGHVSVWEVSRIQQ